MVVVSSIRDNPFPPPPELNWLFTYLFEKFNQPFTQKWWIRLEGGGKTTRQEGQVGQLFLV